MMDWLEWWERLIFFGFIALFIIGFVCGLLRRIEVVKEDYMMAIAIILCIGSMLGIVLELCLIFS